MPHPTAQNFVQAVVMILDEYIVLSQGEGEVGPGEPYESFDEIDGLAKLTQDFGLYMERRRWGDKHDNPLLTDKRTTDIVLTMLTPTNV